MDIKTEYLSITSSSQLKKFPFRSGELIPGTIEQKLGDRLYLVNLSGQKFKAHSPFNLTGRHIFKVLENQGQLILQLMSQDSKNNPSQKVISQYDKLKPFSQDPLLQEIVSQYLKYNLMLNESEILTIYQFIKKKNKKLNPKWIETIIAMKSKGNQSSANKIDKWLHYDLNLKKLETLLSRLLKASPKNNNPLIQFLLEHYFIQKKKKPFYDQIKNSFNKLKSYHSFQQTDNNRNLSYTLKQSFFLLELLRFYLKNKDNTTEDLIKNQIKLEWESFTKNKSEEDQFFFSLPIAFNDDEMRYLKLKSFPKNNKTGEETFLFEIEPSSLKKIRGFCKLDSGTLHIKLYLIDRNATLFLKSRFLDLYSNNDERYYNLGSYSIEHQEEMDGFLSCQNKQIESLNKN